MRHRGPDSSGSWVAPSGRCVLGHSRLAVIDLETGGQPIPNETGSIAAVVNGMIYNFESLRSRLEDRGYVFRSKGDCEVVVHGYEEWGGDLVDHLHGQFAFALWDDESGRLLLGRDRMGIRPLFVYDDEERLAWASELKGFTQIPDLDAEFLGDYVRRNGALDVFTVGVVLGARVTRGGHRDGTPLTLTRS